MPYREDVIEICLEHKKSSQIISVPWIQRRFNLTSTAAQAVFNEVELRYVKEGLVKDGVD